jgi:hypothetical protein
VPCSGARRRDKVFDGVSAAILGDAVAENEPVEKGNFVNGINRVKRQDEIVFNLISYNFSNSTQLQTQPKL